MDLSMSAIIGIIIGILALGAAIYGLRTADKRRKAEALRRAKQAEKEAQAKAARRAKRRAKKIAQIEKAIEQERAEQKRYEEATRTQVLYANLKRTQNESAEQTEPTTPDDKDTSTKSIESSEISSEAPIAPASETAKETTTEASTETVTACEINTLIKEQGSDLAYEETSSAPSEAGETSETPKAS